MSIIKPKKKKLTNKEGSPSVVLPVKLNEPSSELSDYSILLYGAKKIGKTSLASRFDGALFLACEPGTSALRVYSLTVNDWSTFDKAVTLLEKGGHRYKTIVVDTVDLLYEYAMNEVCRKEKIGHPSENEDFGKTWDKVKKLFKSGIIRLLNLPGCGTILISHAMEKEILSRDGSRIDRTQPTMSNQAMSVVEAIVDIICNYRYVGEKRILSIEGTEEQVGGCRLEENFVVSGGSPRCAGDKVKTIDMGESSAESYDNFISAFNNKQKVADVTVTESKPRTVNKKVRISKKRSK